jgi:putative OPT family oligopeptide transporter
MEVVEIVAVVLLAFFLMAPIVVLHQANLATGGIGGRALPAPQAGLMAQLAKGIVGGQMAWGLLAIGAAFGVALIFCGANAPMLVAVGMYLPFETVSAIFAGGLIRWAADSVAARRSEEVRTLAEERGTLLASGLIAGEAILGIVLAVLAVSNVRALARFPWYDAWGGWLSLVGFASLAWLLVRIPLRPSGR